LQQDDEDTLVETSPPEEQSLSASEEKIEVKDEMPTDEADYFASLLKQLSQPIPPELVRQRIGWVDGAGNEHEIDYIEWHTAADILDQTSPQWSHTIKDMKQIGDLLVVTAAITILGITREGMGTGAAYDEKGIKKAEHDALKRAAVKFGVARELYKKPEPEPAAHATANLSLGSLLEPATQKQLAAIHAIAQAQALDVTAECAELFNCKPIELTRRAASALIDHLKLKQSSTKSEIRRAS
jgi:hypothetical protein